VRLPSQNTPLTVVQRLTTCLVSCADLLWKLKIQTPARTLFLAIVRPALCYATQVWSPQSIELVRKIERVQRRASKFILKLPFICTESYKDRLMSINLLPVSYSLELVEYLDLMFFFKAINGIITVPKEILPKLNDLFPQGLLDHLQITVLSRAVLVDVRQPPINGHFLLEQLEPGTLYPNT
jgi:hypothetical protein